MLAILWKPSLLGDGIGCDGMGRIKGYIFTSKEYSKKGIMSTILGTLACITLGMSVYLSYLDKGVPSPRYGTAALLAVIYMSVGIILGVWSTLEKEKFKLFTVLGIIINVLAFGSLSLILFAGAYID